jgi:hypothetical protein
MDTSGNSAQGEHYQTLALLKLGSIILRGSAIICDGHPQLDALRALHRY